MRDIVAAGDVAHRVDGFVERGDVGIETPVAMLRGRIAPADTEGLNAALEQKSDHAFVRRQIHRVIFVDLRRGDDQRPLPYRRASSACTG